MQTRSIGSIARYKVLSRDVSNERWWLYAGFFFKLLKTAMMVVSRIIKQTNRLRLFFIQLTDTFLYGRNIFLDWFKIAFDRKRISKTVFVFFCKHTIQLYGVKISLSRDECAEF